MSSVTAFALGVAIISMWIVDLALISIATSLSHLAAR